MHLQGIVLIVAVVVFALFVLLLHFLQSRAESSQAVCVVYGQLRTLVLHMQVPAFSFEIESRLSDYLTCAAIWHAADDRCRHCLARLIRSSTHPV